MSSVFTAKLRLFNLNQGGHLLVLVSEIFLSAVDTLVILYGSYCVVHVYVMNISLNEAGRLSFHIFEL